MLLSQMCLMTVISDPLLKASSKLKFFFPFTLQYRKQIKICMFNELDTKV